MGGGRLCLEKKNVLRYLRLDEKAPTAQVCGGILAMALSSVADRAVVPLYDWLGLGDGARLNRPGMLGGNWTWRAAAGFGTAALADAIRDECAVYGRCPAKETAKKNEKAKKSMEL